MTEYTPHRHAADGHDGDEEPSSSREAFDARHTPDEAGAVELEPGWMAARALTRISSDELLAIMLRPSFRPVKDLDLVPVSRCPYCLDGGLRTAGSVRTRKGRERVRACDTCTALEVGGSVAAPRG